MRRNIPAILAIMTAIMIFPRAAECSVFMEQKTALVGLMSVGVIIEVEGADAFDQDGRVNGSQAVRIVQDLLKEAGFRILNENQRLSDPARPFIHVRVRVFKYTDPMFVGLSGYSIRLSLHELVTLNRDITKQVHAITWEQDTSGTVPEYRISSAVEEKVSQLTVYFINQHKDANPDLTPTYRSPE